MSPRGRPRTNKEPKRKAVKVRLCERLHAGKVVEPYRIMEEIITKDRQDLDGVKIGIAWHAGWRPDADGVRTHGKCLKRTDLDRAIDGYDFLIVLNEQSWSAFDDNAKRRLITHEMEHAQIARDGNGEIKVDDKGRIVTRIRKHDFADFRDVVEKFGLPPCLSEVQINDASRPLLNLAEGKGQTAKGTKQADAESPIPDHLELKFKGLRNCECSFNLVEKDGQWYAPYWIKVGNIEQGRGVSDLTGRGSRHDALETSKTEIADWLQDVKLTGGADAKRSMERRIVDVLRQLDEQLDPLLNAAEEEEFAEDDPKDEGPNADEDDS